MKFSWYARRLAGMGPLEALLRTKDAILRSAWRARKVAPRASRAQDGRRWLPAFAGTLPPLDGSALPRKAVDRLLGSASALLEGEWQVFARKHPAFGKTPDWFIDARTGRHASDTLYAFDIPYRNEDAVGNIKYIWEPSRHHHLTVLAAAYYVSGDERYASRVAEHLTSWWTTNRFLLGPHWISGIEIGIRLISWVWARRLLNDWPEASSLFERNPQFLNQLYHHQTWLATFPSRTSSANNHLIAESAGQFIAAAAFPCFAQSDRWRRQSAELIGRQAFAQTFASGLNRELATDYHGMVLELFLGAAIEGELTGHSFGSPVWGRIRAMIDALAAIIDSAGHPPRQGDGDDGVGLLLDGPGYQRWNALLATGSRLFGSLAWWPDVAHEDIRTVLWTRGISISVDTEPRWAARPNLFPDAGHVYLRSYASGEEIWCRGDHGPHGFRSIAAHAHADALSIEFRVKGVEILVDPGTYCYHGDPKWRAYFRSTRAHNTLELMDVDQSESGGPFLWSQHARSRLLAVDGLEEQTSLAFWQAEHSGYVSRNGPVHRRTVTLNRGSRVLTIQDEIRGKNIASAALCFHLGPAVQCELKANAATLSWTGGDAILELPSALNWSLHRGEENPPLGWFSPSFDVKIPTFTLLGTGSATVGKIMISKLRVL
jgi:hypothetical protein